MPVPPIPLDVVRLVLKYLPRNFRARNYGRRPYDYLHPSAAPLMLVCKDWTSLVLDVVWREVCISRVDVHLLVPLLLSRQDLLDRVRVLRIKLDIPGANYNDRFGASEDSMCDTWDGVTLLLHRAKRVTMLDLPATLPYSSFLTTAAYASISATVTTFELDLIPRLDVKNNGDLDSMWSCVARFPLLTRLTVVSGSEVVFATTTGARPKLRVRHFVLDCHEAQYPDLAGTRQMLQQLESAHLHSLELIHVGIRLKGSVDPLSPLNDLTGVRRLVIRTACDEELDDALPRLCGILPRLTRLTELELNYGMTPVTGLGARPATAATTKSPTPVRQLLDALPPSMRRLTVESIHFCDWKPTKWVLKTHDDLQDDTVATVSLQVPAPHNEGGTEIKPFRLVRSAVDLSEWRAVVPIS